MLPALLALVGCASETELPPPTDPVAAAPAPVGIALAATHLPTRAAEIAAQFPDATDRSETFYTTEIASAHMHLIGVDQMCPLHIHRSTHEATLIVTGSADVRHVYAVDGERVETHTEHGVGSLIASPPFSGHEWDNKTGAHQGNLVIAYPGFDGNLYVRPDDPRLMQGGPPFDYHPLQDAEDFEASGDAFDRLDLPVLEGTMSRIFVRDSYEIPASTSAHGLVYGVSGEGRLGIPGEERPLTAGSLLVFQRPVPVTITATGEQRLALYLWEPPIPG